MNEDAIYSKAACNFINRYQSTKAQKAKIKKNNYFAKFYQSVDIRISFHLRLVVILCVRIEHIRLHILSFRSFILKLNLLGMRAAWSMYKMALQVL